MPVLLRCPSTIRKKHPIWETLLESEHKLAVEQMLQWYGLKIEGRVVLTFRPPRLLAGTQTLSKTSTSLLTADVSCICQVKLPHALLQLCSSNAAQ